MKLKKLTSWLLTAVMILSLMPMAVFAEAVPVSDGITTITPYIYMGSTDSEDTKSPVTSTINTSVGSGYSFEFWVGENKITAVTAPIVDGVTITEQTEIPGRFDMSFTKPGEYALVFTVDVGDETITSTINAKVDPAQDGTGGGSEEENSPTTSINIISYSKTGTENWGPAEEVFINHKEGNTGYIRVFDNEMNDISMSDDLTWNYSGDLFTITKDTDKNVLKITYADKNGDAEFSFNYKGSKKTLCLYVSGYVDPAQETYTSAKVVQAKLNADPVTVATGISGTLTDEDKNTGFELFEDGKLTFTKTENAGSYEVTVDGKLYIVAIFPEISTMTELEASDYYATVNPDMDDTVADYITAGGVSGLGDGYHILTIDEGFVWTGEESNFGLDDKGNYTPIYFVKVSGGQLTDLTEAYKIYPNQAMMGKTSYLVAHEYVTINGKKAVKVYPRYDTTETAVNNGYVIRHENGTAVNKNTYVLAGFTLVDSDGLAIEGTDKAISTGAAFLEKTAPSNVRIADNVLRGGGDLELWYDIGSNDYVADTFYFADNNISEGSHAVLFDKIDIASIKVQSTNDDNVKIKEFVVSDEEGNNVIGFKLDRKNLSTFQSEMIVVTFDYEGAEKCIYIPVINREKETEISVQVGKDELENKTLQEIYDTFVGSVLYIEAGEYEEDLRMHRANVKVEGVATEEGGSNLVILKGSSDTSKPIFEVDTMAQVFHTNIAIDGSNHKDANENPTKIGMQTSAQTQMVTLVGKNQQVGVSYIKNCAIGLNVLSTNVNLNLTAVPFENNTVAVQAKCHLNINESTFKNNGTAIKLDATGRSEGIPRITIKENNFIGNTTDVELSYLNSTSASVTQNYFDGNKPVIVNDTRDKVFWSPFYTDETRTVMSASLEGAENTAVTRSTTTAYKLPVTLEYSDVTTFDSNVFKEINNATGDITAAVPVTEIVENVPTVTTEWNFDKETLLASDKLPATMDLKVVDELSEDAYEIVAAAVTNPETIVQQVQFAHEGVLPGKATVKIIKTTDVTAENLKLYYVDETNGEVVELAVCDVTEVTENNVTYFVVTVDHCSEYIIATGNIVIENKADDATDSEEDKSSSSSSSKKDKETATATPAPTTAPVTAKPTTATTANDFISAQEVEAKLDASTADEVIFDVIEKEIVSSKAFEALAEAAGKALVFETDSFRWTFEASDITDASAIEGTTFKPAISLDSPNAKAIKALVGDESIINIFFEHHGKLPGKAKVEVFVGEAEAGKTKHVYHHIPAQNGFEFIETITLTEKGWAAFEIYGCSDYILSDVLLEESLVIKTEAETPTQPETPVDTPVEEPVQQDGGMGVMPIILIAVVVLAVVIVLLKKRKTE